MTLTNEKFINTQQHNHIMNEIESLSCLVYLKIR